MKRSATVNGAQMTSAPRHRRENRSERAGHVLRLRYVVRARWRPWVNRALLYTFLGVSAAAVLLPVVWMLMTSLKPEADVVRYPPRLLPREWSVEAYRDIWQRLPFGLFFRNTLLFAGSVTAISLFFDSLAAYALARLQFRGRDLLFLLVLSTMMVPFQVTMIPLFVTLYRLNLVNTYFGLVLPRATNAFGIFMLRQFFVTLPKDLEDAARIDGASEFCIYRSIILPLSKPALITVGIFHFMYNWNDLLWPLIVTTSVEMRTLPAGLALFMGQHVVEYAVLMAGTTIALAPLFIGFLVAQRYFVQGIALTGLKV